MARFPHSLSLNEEDEAMLKERTDRGYSLVGLLRQGFKATENAKERKKKEKKRDER